MPVFDFNNTPDKDKPLTCTYTTFRSDESTATPERPMLVLDNEKTAVETPFQRILFQSGEADDF